jgi:hypothetical protein
MTKSERRRSHDRMVVVFTTTLQSLCDSLAFCTRTLPAGRAFSRRLYLATAKAKKTHQILIKYFLR